MAEYIERKKVYADISRLIIGKSAADFTDYEEGRDDAVGEILKIIKEYPAANVRPERHGEWVDIGDGYVACSECGEEHGWQDYRASYCDTCGAKMSWEEDTI